MSENEKDRQVVVGGVAPDFRVKGYYDHEVRHFSLSDYKGKWVYLLFYPLDFTFVCPTEVLSFSDKVPEFEKLNCQVLGVSVDSHHTHRAWVETEKAQGGLGGSLNYPLLSDLEREIINKYGVMDDGGVALRGLFLIDPEGNVVHATINNDPVGRSTTEALRVLKAYHFVAENDGSVCPANWDKGKEGMTPSSEGVARYLAKHAKEL